MLRQLNRIYAKTSMNTTSGGPNRPLPAALPGQRVEFASRAGRVSCYRSLAEASGSVPLVLIHSINAAGSAAEMRPVYMRYRESRPVYAVDLPGFGFSDRSERPYTPRLMTDAIHALVRQVREQHDCPVDALALSLGCEFLARAASESPEDYRSLGLVSPTGFRGGAPRLGPSGAVVGSERIHAVLAWSGWRKGLYGLLTRRSVIRYFLERTWGSRQIDEELLDYDYATTHQPGAEHAPLSFLAALLFSKDALRLYDSLRMPVWMVHGVCGDFVDYRQKARFAAAGNWTTKVLPTGALPYFETPLDFFREYDAFLTGLAPH